jgi:hypothetical protein
MGCGTALRGLMAPLIRWAALLVVGGSTGRPRVNRSKAWEEAIPNTCWVVRYSYSV